MLADYDRDFTAIEFLTGDNAYVNGRLADLISKWLLTHKKIRRIVPLVGCAAHRLNLAVQHLVSKTVNKVWFDLILKIHTLMVDLKTIKNRPKLASVTSLSPKIRQDTRWNSIFEMILRYLELCEKTNHFRSCVGLSAGTRTLVPTHEGADNEHDKIKELHEILKKFDSTSKSLQFDDPTKVSFDRVRFYFDKLKTQHPENAMYLSEDGINVHNKPFESAITKIQSAVRKKEMTVDLDRWEKEAVQVFLNVNENSESEEEEGERSFIELADEEFEQQSSKRLRTEFPYRSTAHVAATSVIAERLFSRCGIIMRPHRRLMDPSTLEMLVLIRFNKDLWDEQELDILIKSRTHRDNSLVVEIIQEPFATPVSGGGSVSSISSNSSSNR